MRRFTMLLSLLTMTALILTACPAPPPAPASEPAAPAAAEATKPAADAPAAAPAASGNVIKIATHTPLSGPQSALGVGIKNGAQLALEQYTGKLKEMGLTVELAPYDDQATPETGVANAKQIVADPSILCVVGHLNSGVFIPSSEEYHNAGLAAVSPANTNPKVTTRGYAEVNRVVGRDDVQGVVAAEFASTELGVKTAYIIHDKTAYGQGVAEFFRAHAEELGIKVLGFEGTEEQANFDSLLTPIVAANPDLVYTGAIYTQAGLIYKQAREKGITAKFMGPDGVDSGKLIELAGADTVKDMNYTSTAGPLSLFPDAAQFQKDYEAKYGEAVQPYGAEGFDAMNICLGGIEKAAGEANGMPSREAVTKAVRATQGYKGITGEKSFNEIGDLTTAKYFVFQVTAATVEDWGKNEIVKVLDIAAPANK